MARGCRAKNAVSSVMQPSHPSTQLHAVVRKMRSFESLEIRLVSPASTTFLRARDGIMRRIFSVMAAATGVVSVGCGAPDHGGSGAGTAPRSPPPVTLAQTCPLAVPGTGGDAPKVSPRLFLEIVAVEGRQEIGKPPPGPLEFARWLDAPGETPRSLGGLIATSGVATRMPFAIPISEGNVMGAPAVSPWNLAVTPHVGDAPSPELRLELTIEAADGADASPSTAATPPARRAHTTLVMRDQQPAFIALEPSIARSPKERPWMLLLTPYVVRSDEDLRRLFECRAARRASAKH
jgi:hypothetical protein